jgi:polar amino acid transport system substrate-binding protein
MYNRTGARALGFYATVVSLYLGVTTAASGAEFDAKLNGLLPDSIRDSKVVKVAAPRQLPPNIYEENGILKGEAPELMRAIEPILGVKFDFADVQWPGVLPGIQAGRYDMSIGTVTYSKERESLFNMIVYRSNTEGILVTADAAPIKEELELCGKTVGSVQGSNVNAVLTQLNEECARKGLTPITIKMFPSTGLAVLALKAKNVDFYPGTYAGLAYIAATSDGTYSAYVIPTWRGLPQGAAIAKSEEGLAKAVTGALQVLHDTGEYQSILKKFGLESTILPKAEISLNPGIDTQKRVTR